MPSRCVFHILIAALVMCTCFSSVATAPSISINYTESDSANSSVSLSNLLSTMRENKNSSADVAAVVSAKRFMAFYGHPFTMNQFTVQIPNKTVNAVSRNVVIRVTSHQPDILNVIQESVMVTACTANKNNETLPSPTANYTTANDTVLSDDQVTYIDQSLVCYNVTFKATGQWFGYSQMKIELITEAEPVFLGRVVGACISGPSKIAIIFNLTLQILVTIAHFGMGVDLDLETLKVQLKSPKAIIIGLCSQFMVMPLLAYSIVMVMGYSGGTAIGLFLLGISPGGTSSNMFSKLFNGDVTTSVTMTTASTIVSLGMIPFWLYTLGKVIPGDGEVGRLQIPFVSILKALAFILIPVLIGLLFKLKLPKVAQLLRRGLKVFYALLCVVLFTLAIYSNLHIFRVFTIQLALSSAALPYGGYLIGGLIAWIFRLNWPLIKTVAVETGQQNVVVALMILQTALRSPDVDLAMIPALTAAFMTAMPLLLVLPAYMCWTRRYGQQKPGSDAKVNLEDKELADIKISDDVTSLDLSESAADDDVIQGQLLLTSGEPADIPCAV